MYLFTKLSLVATKEQKFVDISEIRTLWQLSINLDNY